MRVILIRVSAIQKLSDNDERVKGKTDEEVRKYCQDCLSGGSLDIKKFIEEGEITEALFEVISL